MTITNQGIAAAPTALVPLAFPGAAELDAIRNAGTLAARSTALRDCFVAKPENCFIALMFARDMQIPPMLALTRGFVIKGSFDLDTEIKLDIVMSRIPGFDYEIVELSNERCQIRGGIAGRNPHEVTVTSAQMRLAPKLEGYGLSDPYVQDKLLWRCISRLIRRTGAGRAYMMLGALTVDESDERTGSPEKSGAAVVEDETPVSGARTTSPATPPAEPQQITVGPAVDPQARLARAIAKHYGMKEPQGPHFGRWMKANEKIVLQAINLWSQSRGEPPYPRILAFPPMDRDRVAEWLEKHADKRAGKVAVADNGEAASMDAPGQESGPASLSEAEPMNAAPLEDDADVEPGGARLAALGLDRVVEVLLALKAAHTKPGRPRDFIQKSAQTKRWMLVDSEILVTCGYTNGEGAPLSQWLDKLSQSEGAWLTVCNAIYDLAVGAKVDLFRE